MSCRERVRAEKKIENNYYKTLPKHQLSRTHAANVIYINKPLRLSTCSGHTQDELNIVYGQRSTITRYRHVRMLKRTVLTRIYYIVKF